MRFGCGLERDQSCHIAAIGIHGVGPHVVEGVLQLRILRGISIGQIARIGNGRDAEILLFDLN